MSAAPAAVLSGDTTLGDVVSTDPRRARVLESHAIDYCCHGGRSLAQACADAGLDLAALIGSLQLPDERPVGPVGEQVAGGAGGVTGGAPSPTVNSALAHDIVDTHHAYMWEEMPRLQALVEKVHTVHGQRHPELATVRDAFTAAITALDPHMTKEERRVFPAISRLERDSERGPGSGPATGSTLRADIEDLRAEHNTVGELFKRLREVTGGYAVPADACGSYKAMLAGLEAMELDLHEHIHKENNILFNRVEQLLGGAG